MNRKEKLFNVNVIYFCLISLTNIGGYIPVRAQVEGISRPFIGKKFNSERL